jgi:DNA-binding NtrC family response regulator
MNNKKLLYSILLVDDDVKFCESLKRALKEEFNVQVALNGEEARKLIWSADLAIIDVRLNPDSIEGKEGLELLKEFHSERPSLPIVMITAYGDISTAVEAMKLGAVDFLTKPLDLTKLKVVIKNSIKTFTLQTRVKSLEDELTRIEPIELVGEDRRIKEIRELIEHVSKDGYVTVLITGETGTGKELVARLIHKRGWRAEREFVPLSLASLSPTLIERELFGHEKGAFTDAKDSKPGFIERANRGILFLDDINLAPLDVQSKLLRFLEERAFCRLGSTKPIKVDVQVIVATNQNLQELVKEGKFRQDLYYRINTVEINLPPLREHPQDIPLLSEHFLRVIQRQGRTDVEKISDEAINTLMKYSWPGNVRELRNCIERALLFAKFKGHKIIEIDDLPSEVREYDKSWGKESYLTIGDGVDVDEEKAKLELAFIQSALKEAEGKKTKAWKLLGLKNRFSLRRRVLSIAKKYPHLIKEYPLIERLFYKNKFSKKL